MVQGQWRHLRIAKRGVINGVETQPTLRDGDLVLRPLVADDLDPMALAASDPLIWEQHPAKERATRAGFDPYFAKLLNQGNTLAVVNGGVVVGMTTFYDIPNEPEDIAIGYTFLRRDQWGTGVNARMKKLVMDHVFQTLPRLILHVDPQNFRSQAAVAKIGGVWLYDADLALGGGDPLPYKVYEVTA